MITDSALPNHVGLIPDGARRWARENSYSYLYSYRKAMKLIEAFIDFMFRNQVANISVYLLSVENLKRSPEELEIVFQAEIELLTNLLPEILRKYPTRIIHAGRSELLSKDYANAISSLSSLSSYSSSDSHKLYLLAGYNPFDEIRCAVGESNIHRPLKMEDLWVPTPVDLIVRTSGENRISNFLPLQAGYAEIYFETKLLNDISEADMLEYLSWYRIRRTKRRYGK